MARVTFAPGSSVISMYLYQRQLSVAGTYRITSGGNRVRAWNPPRTIVHKMRQVITQRDAGVCQLCFATATWPELDHITPYRDGGLYIEWNLQLACAKCNARKGARGGE